MLPDFVAGEGEGLVGPACPRSTFADPPPAWCMRMRLRWCAYVAAGGSKIKVLAGRTWVRLFNYLHVSSCCLRVRMHATECRVVKQVK